MADEPTNEENKQDKDDFGALTGGDDSESSDTGADDSDTFGMGSLPPLSDFDSGEDEGEDDSDLPPLDTPDSGEDEGPISGLPPIIDIRVDTPAVRPSDLDAPTPSQPDEPETPTPAGFDTPDDALDSPEPAGLGFQDFAADSDFSPETPEIGPGPDSDIETPMFDSAFGGDADDFTTGGTGTSAPTQAMETPLFGSQPEVGFDNDAFGVPTPDVGVDSGTPVPDFSPDTGGGVTTGTGIPAAPIAAPPKKRNRVVVMFVSLLLMVVGAAIGIAASQAYPPHIPYLPDKAADELQEKVDDITLKEGEIKQLTRQLNEFRTTAQTGTTPITGADLDKLIKQVRDTESELESKQAKLFELDNSLELVVADIEEKNSQFVEAQENLDDLNNEYNLTQAQYKGLLAENDRLTEVVGELEVANARRQASKDTLLHNIDLLIVQVQGGSPLAPERYDYISRLARASDLRDKVARAKWVDPQLLDEYTGLYLAELGIASSREYFFARIPVHDKLDNIIYRWAECLMNGNWSVYFLTIDGKHVGSYENAAGSGPPRYEFREDLPGAMRSDILNAIRASRVEDYKEKIAVLAQKQKIYETKSKYQIEFNSL